MDRIEAMRLFARVVERRSFSAAARELRVKQSTASKWVAALEEELGVTLVERTTRAVHVTDEGRRFLARANEIVAAYDDASRAFAALCPEPSGRVRVSVPVVFGRRFVVPPVVAFLRAHPQVEVELAFLDRYVNLVEEGFDLAIRVGVPVDTSARGRKLADGARRVVASPAYLKRHGRPRTPKDLARHECLAHGDPSGPTVWRFGRERGVDVPVPVRGRVAANNSEAVLQLARDGLGVALLADWLVADDVAKKRLVVLLEGFHTTPAPIWALTPPGRYTPAAVRLLIDGIGRSLDERSPARRRVPRRSAPVP